jgi:uncharacterized protein YxeA
VAGIDIQAAAAAVGCNSNGENNQLKATAVTHLKNKQYIKLWTWLQ